MQFFDIIMNINFTLCKMLIKFIIHYQINNFFL
jgi:hypothetical protein